MVMLQRSLIPIKRSFCFNLGSKSKFFSQTLAKSSNLSLNSVQFDAISRDQDDDSVGRLHWMLQGCRGPSDLQKGKKLHAQFITNGFRDDELVVSKLLSMYVLSGSLSDAKGIFFTLENKSCLHWNWMIRGFNMMGLFDFSLLFYFKMFFSGLLPDQHTFASVMKTCCSLSAVGLGRLIHGMIWAVGLEEDMFVGSSLIKLYAQNGCISDAREVFDRMHERDAVSWNVMIDGYITNKDMKEAIELFGKMRSSGIMLNYVSFACMLSVCAAEGLLEYGVQLHGLAVKCGVELEASVANTLLAMYSKCRCLHDVRMLFGLMPQPDVISWNGMISGYVQSGLKDEALDLFNQMQKASVKPDAVTLASLLPSFSDSTSSKQGKEVHAYVVRNAMHMDAFLKSALIDTYFKSKDVELARKVFYATRSIDIVICSAMISGYVLNGMSHDALEMFRTLLEALLKPNAITLASVLPACSSLNALRLGKELHGYVLKHTYESRCYVASALMDMYAKCCRLNICHLVFRSIPIKDAVAWNSMITSFAQNGQPEEAISHFRQMRIEGVGYDCVTISAVLSACASLPAIHYGKEIHGFMMRGDLQSDLFAESALIDMYSKCGNFDWACHVFNSMRDKNEVSWNSIIAAYGTHGLLTDTIILFQQMQVAGFQPDHITFIALLSACGHSGQVEEGFKVFRCMSDEFGISPQMEHYASMVDLFGRAGHLHEALNFITSMPFKPDAGIWGALLGACRVHRNVELAELASRHLFELDPQNSGYYVLMSNINSLAGRLDGVSKVRSLMRERRVQKVPGCSWIEINSANHLFISADKSHPSSAQIYFLLKLLIQELREAGYVPQADYIYPQQQCATGA